MRAVTFKQLQMVAYTSFSLIWFEQRKYGNMLTCCMIFTVHHYFPSKLSHNFRRNCQFIFSHLRGKRQNPCMTMWGVKWLHYEQDCGKFPHSTFQSMRWEFYLQIGGALPLIQNKTWSKSWHIPLSSCITCRLNHCYFLLKISHVQNGNRLYAIGNTSITERVFLVIVGVLRFGSRSGHRLSWLRSPGKCRDSTSIKLRSLPSRSFSVHNKSYHPTRYSLGTESVVN
jgi:hypothetical protein